MILALFALWLIFSGKITGEILCFGVVLSVAVYAFCRKFLEYDPKKEWKAVRLLPQVLWYGFVLVVEVVKANLVMFFCILSPKYEMEPVLVTFHTDLKTDLARTVLANSITLTPGTITAELAGNELRVHCLDKDMAVGMEQSVFVKLLKRMEKTVQK